MQESDGNANSTADRRQTVPAETLDARVVVIREAGTVESRPASDLPAVIPGASSSDSVAAYVRRRWRPFALDAEHNTALTCIVGVLSLVAFVAAVTSRSVEGYGSVAVESNGSPRLVVDVRSAEWTDFAMLPGVGPTLARRMVEARDAAGGDLGPETFESVRGVGPKTWRRIEPFLKFPER
ncbi:MAG TPA: helix-hairpin-helix domain-containing protein [Pirellulaceae bacterium]|jgi:DNA uptake protein ComE-like DNA-binding protein|nr:helix-hairpin-helix domain-containing protein [Pirellulaceae bacterium]